MSPAAPARGPTPQGPTEPTFYQRYSPHHELPLSSTTSVTLHALAVGALLLFGAYLFAGRDRAARQIPVEPVRLDLTPTPKLGGGPGERGQGPGLGPLPEKREGPAEGPLPGEPDAPLPPRPRLSPAERAAVPKLFDPASARHIRENQTRPTRGWWRLDEMTRDELALPGGPGAGGPGGPGKGPGAGPGVGPGKGPGTKATLSPREKRMLRWNLRFPAGSPPEYLRQLDRLGAVLAVPITEGPPPRYKVVRDLEARPARLLDEDISKIQRIYWVDDDPASARGVTQALGLRLRPSRFIAFMPAEVERRLSELEKEAYERQYGRYDEEQIYETHFRVNPRAGYRIEVVSLTLRGPGR